MAEKFYGPWSIEVTFRSSRFDEQFVIDGSDSMDGNYSSIPGTPMRVDGGEWTITLEWRLRPGSNWTPSRTRRVEDYTVDHGFVVELASTHRHNPKLDHVPDDVTLRLVSLNPMHTPLHPIVNPYDFTVPEDILGNAIAGHPRPDNQPLNPRSGGPRPRRRPDNQVPSGRNDRSLPS